MNALDGSVFLGKKRGEGALVRATKVSVLIPARDEERNIGKAIDAVLAQSIEPYEIIILDDDSQDNTAQVVSAYGQQVQLVKGKGLPKGWLGKNWACHQLALKASGDTLLFIDADVILSPDAIEKAVETMSIEHLGALSIFPDQLMLTWGEKIIVPMMHQLLLTLLPLRFVRTMGFPSLSAANGQFIVVRADIYNAYMLHEQVKTEVVEDIAMFRLLKELKLQYNVNWRVATYVGGGSVHCRMYNGFGESIQGFSKNLLAGFGNNSLGLLLFLGLLTLGHVPAMVYYPTGWYIWICTGAVFLQSISLGYLMKTSPVRLFMGYPFRIIAMVWIAALSIKKRWSGTNTWKGRVVG